MKNLAEYESVGFEGIDASLETSLFEYGLIWAKGIEGHENDYHFIYGVGNDGESYTSFDWGDIAVDTNPTEEWNFVDWDEVGSFVGMSEEDLLKQPLPQLVFDLISYYGFENIMGSSYYPFEIKA